MLVTGAMLLCRSLIVRCGSDVAGFSIANKNIFIKEVCRVAVKIADKTQV